MKLKLLLSPLTQGAYFADAVQVARAEYLAHYPDREIEAEQVASLVFLNVDAEAEDFEQLARLSFVQAIFRERGGALAVVDQEPGFDLPEQMVWGVKYQGKTNELVTQLAINVGLTFCDTNDDSTPSVLDPMAGRGTTLLWALRYGFDARGIELEPKALAGLQQHVKKQTKLHRIKHKQIQGSVGKFNRKDHGRFLQYQFGDRTLRLTTGDGREADDLLQRQRFHLIVSDLPYGVQHTAPGGTRNPLRTIEECAPIWCDCLRPGGAMVLIFNAYQPRRAELVRPFVESGLQLQEFAAPHRMSESIVRDLVVFTKPSGV
jgi:hypothetical protein